MSLTFQRLWAPIPKDEDHSFKAPVQTDARGPCPFLNTVANHGYIPRDGRYLTWPIMVRGLMHCYNHNLLLAIFVASAGFYTSLFMTGNPFWFDLDQLRVHNTISIEHDASLTRADVSSGDNHDSNPELLKELLSYASSPDGITYEDFSALRIHREIMCLPGPLADSNTIRDFLATGEIGLMLATVARGDADLLKRKFDLNWLKSFMGPSKLPEGWYARPDKVTLKDVNTIRAKVQEKMKELRANDAAAKKTS